MVLSYVAVMRALASSAAANHTCFNWAHLGAEVGRLLQTVRPDCRVWVAGGVEEESAAKLVLKLRQAGGAAAADWLHVALMQAGELKGGSTPGAFLAAA